ncbi:MAG: MFS transporter [Hyphomicrobiaceae bacterium]
MQHGLDHHDPKAASEASRAFLVSLLILTFLMNTVGRGITETFAVFLLPVERGLSATRAEMTATYSIFAMAYGFSAPFTGQLIDRLGARITYGFGLTVLGLGYALAGLATSVWHYYLCVGLLGGLGSAALGMVIASSLLSRWFTTRIGSIMSLPYAAVGAGMLLLPPLTQILLARYGWRSTHQLLGMGVLFFIPLILLLPLDRVTEGSPEWQAKRREAAQLPQGAWRVSTAVRTSAFWGLAAAYFWTSVAAYSVLPQSVAYLVEQGFDPLVAASAFGLTGALSVVGIITIGWLSDRIGRRQAVSLSYVLSILGTSSLILVAVFPSLLLVYGFVLFFGLMQGARGPIILAFITVLFPGGGVGAIFGTMSLAMGIGAGIGSFVSGWFHEITGTYYASFLLGMMGSLLGLASFWVVPSLRHERIGRPPAADT